MPPRQGSGTSPASSSFCLLGPVQVLVFTPVVSILSKRYTVTHMKIMYTTPFTQGTRTCLSASALACAIASAMASALPCALPSARAASASALPSARAIATATLRSDTRTNPSTEAEANHAGQDVWPCVSGPALELEL
eukprot:CAMPEP_0202889630 /NCGR_PEP_ID=MMETSP1392-20130828/222_1 /ASSEMBLY_ACC=CAM_ASM_000868 /TAXON_ID=225041 /ORGANISM="Chlamydomonas chlamydogama, Strain SAG 11-48b" /LENGTH=136 /DNA_ID=CAMNT_0049573007 /DNA_START=386 /DNA_END=797 /DNA_ORIENTATION=-